MYRAKVVDAKELFGENLGTDQNDKNFNYVGQASPRDLLHDMMNIKLMQYILEIC